MNKYTIEVSRNIFKDIDAGVLQVLTIPAGRSAQKTFAENPPHQIGITIESLSMSPQIVFAFTGYQASKCEGKDVLELPLKNRQYNLF